MHVVTEEISLATLRKRCKIQRRLSHQANNAMDVVIGKMKLSMMD